MCIIIKLSVNYALYKNYSPRNTGTSLLQFLIKTSQFSNAFLKAKLYTHTHTRSMAAFPAYAGVGHSQPWSPTLHLSMDGISP